MLYKGEKNPATAFHGSEDEISSSSGDPGFSKRPLPSPQPLEAGMCLHGSGFPEIKVDVFWDFSVGPVVKNLPCNTVDMGLIPSRGTKIPPTCLGTTKPVHHNQRVREPRCKIPHDITKIPSVAYKIQSS